MKTEAIFILAVLTILTLASNNEEIILHSSQNNVENNNATRDVNANINRGSLEDDDIIQEESGETINRKWPGGKVFYEISEDFRPNQVHAIKMAMQAIEEISCVRFIPKTKETMAYITVVIADLCNAKLGYSGKQQYVRLRSANPGVGCFKKFKIVHELMHVLGFIHEQNLPNRNKYIKVDYENIKENHTKQFRIVHKSETNFGLPYDYESLMHYGPHLFSKNGKDTIIPFDPKANIGQREKFSELDIKKINLYYNCENQNESDQNIMNKTTTITTTTKAND